MKQITTSNMQAELTPTIAEMSAVVAKYMGWKWVLRHADDIDWNMCHEVWEKVREEIESNFIPFNGSGLSVLYFELGGSILKGTPLETLTALYNCIKFINQLKQQ
jgi:hypothetical protein